MLSVVGPTMTNRGGVYSFVLIFICAIVTIDVLYMQQRVNVEETPVEEALEKPVPEEPRKVREHKVAGLSCKAYGGPSDEDAAEMVYWQDIPVDASFVSPFKSQKQQYLTFEPGTFAI